MFWAPHRLISCCGHLPLVCLEHSGKDALDATHWGDIPVQHCDFGCFFFPAASTIEAAAAWRSVSAHADIVCLGWGIQIKHKKPVQIPLLVKIKRARSKYTTFIEYCQAHGLCSVELCLYPLYTQLYTRDGTAGLPVIERM